MLRKDAQQTFAKNGNQGIVFASSDLNRVVGFNCSDFSGGGCGGVVLVWTAIAADNVKGILSRDIGHG